MVLRITLEKGTPPRATLKLEGSVSGEWVGLLEQECIGLLHAWGGLRLDLAGVVFVDRAGVEALGRLSRAGAEIGGCSGAVASVLEGEEIRITRNPEEGKGEVNH